MAHSWRAPPNEDKPTAPNEDKPTGPVVWALWDTGSKFEWLPCTICDNVFVFFGKALYFEEINVDPIWTGIMNIYDASMSEERLSNCCDPTAVQECRKYELAVLC